MRALSIRQPFAELILRGIKTVEYRSRPTRIIGERFYLYASKGAGKKIWSRDLAVPDAEWPRWMLELAEQVGMIEPELLAAGLPTGVIVGSAIVEKVVPPEPSARDGLYQWHLAGVERARTLLKPTGHPQPVWFEPF
jgi:hypothetical protein